MLEANRPFVNFPFARRRQLGRWFLLSLLALDLAYSAIVNLALFAQGWLNSLAAAAHGLLQPGMVSYLVKIPPIAFDYALP